MRKKPARGEPRAGVPHLEDREEEGDGRADRHARLGATRREMAVAAAISTMIIATLQVKARNLRIGGFSSVCRPVGLPRRCKSILGPAFL